MRFAARTEFGGSGSVYGLALQTARTRDDFVDLTISNPTRCGFRYDAFDLRALGREDVLHYKAEPLGALTAREAVGCLYNGLSPARLLLTASSSEAYGYLLRLLCDPGDQLLVPSPSYPLFDLLARLHDVEIVSYPLVYHDGWQLDPSTLHAAVTPRTRAIVAIHPNNPTGHFCSAGDRATLNAVARQHGLPLIVDEVFLEYSLEGSGTTFVGDDAPVLTFVLGGLSKSLALPQMKLGWTAVCGPQDLVDEAMDRLEVIADTFLSVGTPVQVAAASWLPQRAAIQQQVLTRISRNLASLDAALQGSALNRLRVEGGWSVVLRVPALEHDEAFAARLLQEQSVSIHPGSFYGFPEQGWLVLSLLPDPDHFAQGVRRLLQAF